MKYEITVRIEDRKYVEKVEAPDMSKAQAKAREKARERHERGQNETS